MKLRPLIDGTSKVIYHSKSNLYEILPVTRKGRPVYAGSILECNEWVEEEKKDAILDWVIAWDKDIGLYPGEVMCGTGPYTGTLFNSEEECLEAIEEIYQPKEKPTRWFIIFQGSELVCARVPENDDVYVGTIFHSERACRDEIKRLKKGVEK